MTKQRIPFLDYIRVVACFLVMLVHASENFYGADSSGLAGNMSMLASNLLCRHHEAALPFAGQQMGDRSITVIFCKTSLCTQ